MSQGSSTKVRSKTIEALQEVVVQRKLQVSTLEGILHETRDMLYNDSLREPFLQLMINLTRAQIDELGLALRGTFFELITEIGFEELSLKWLRAMTIDGKSIEPFEYKIADLLSVWLTETLELESHSQAIELIEYTEKLFTNNAAFIEEEYLRRIVLSCCRKACHGSPDSYIPPILLLLESILKFSYIPQSQLFNLISTMCLLTCHPDHSMKAWRVMRIVLTSVNAYSALKMLQGILTNLTHSDNECTSHGVVVKIVRGAVFCVAMALWGSQRIEVLRCPSSVMLPSLTEAMAVDPLAGKEVLLALKRLVGKYGKTLQQLTWNCVLQSLERAVKLCKADPLMRNEMLSELHKVINIIEHLYAENEYAGSSEAFFLLVELCVEDRPDESVIGLIDYKVSCIDPLSGSWLKHMASLIEKYIVSDGNSLKRREKALVVLNETYNKYRLLYEQDIIRQLILKFCSKIADEKDATFQYQLINVLFAVAKTVTLRVNSDNELFKEIIKKIDELLNGSVKTFVTNDNLEVVATSIGDVLNERWKSFDIGLINMIFAMLFRHIQLQYFNGFIQEIGADVRARIFESLLLVHCDPLTGQLTRLIIVSSPSQIKRVTNTRVVRAGDDTAGEFSWSQICQVVTQALVTEQWWPVLRSLLECLSGVFEFRLLVYTAGEKAVTELITAILGLHKRNVEGQILSTDGELPKYLCPVLSKLINYTNDVALCRILVDCVAGGCVQAIMACDLAVQVLPDKMAIVNRQLMESLASLRPSAVLAIPIIELISDSAEVDAFHEFFQPKHFKLVVDVLAPYCNNKFNTFIVASVHRVMMRWYARVPEKDRLEIGQYALAQFAKVNFAPENLHETNSFKNVNTYKTERARSQEAPNKQTHQLEATRSVLHATINSGMGCRQPSGDGRQMNSAPFEEPLPIFSIGAPSLTPDVSSPTVDMVPNEGPMEVVQAQPTVRQEQERAEKELRLQLVSEALDSLAAFFRFFRKRNQNTFISQLRQLQTNTTASEQGVSEKRIEHWIIDDSILTLRVLAKVDEENDDSLARRLQTISIDRPSGLKGPAAASVAAKAVSAAISENPNQNIESSKQLPEDPLSSPVRDLRRRHQSAIQGPTTNQRQTLARLSQKTTLDDSFPPTRETMSVTDLVEESALVPTVEWIQLTVRHLYGKDSWMMRSFDRIPEDFDAVSSIPVIDPSSLLLHLRGHRDAVFINPKEKEATARTLRNLDRISPEEFHAVGVLYIGEDQTTEQEILSNQYGSERYAKFIRLLGKVTSLEGNPGGLVPGKHGRYTFEDIEAIARTVFLVATLMPKSENDPKCNAKKALIGNNFVSIVFNESGVPYKLGTVSGQFNHIALEVVPHDEETVCITLHARREIACWLAMTRAFLPDAQAVKVLRKMAIRAQLSVNHDTFFNSPNGRLKLREFCGLGQEEAELIFYDRPDTEGPKLSSFVKASINDPKNVKEALKMSAGIKAELHKTRTLFVYDQTRIHLDEVQDLGDFMELEVCLRDDQTVEEGQHIAFEIMEKLQIPKEALMSGAYVDSLK
uniref:Rap-GAP domain-containing protein n=1 Tax=Acrobeloides nanus TaxID=290746 RepID=A0A914C549_9BILA